MKQFLMKPSLPVFCGMGILLAASHILASAPVIPANAAAVKRAVAAQKGRVVLVNFWATWCGPCVAEFPDIVALSRRYKSWGLSVLAVSADSARDVPGKVTPFLEKQRVTFPVYLQKSGDPEEFINAFDPSWQGDLPRTFIYDRQGKLVKILAGAQTAPQFAAAIAPYLKR